MIYVRRGTTLRFFLDNFTRLTFGADEQNRALIGGQLTHVLERVQIERQRLFEVDNVYLVAVAEDKRGHLGMPVTGLMSEMVFAQTPRIGTEKPLPAAHRHFAQRRSSR